MTTYHKYDDASQITEIIHLGPSGVLQSLYYAYDDAGRRTRIDREDGTSIYYGYDDADRLTGEDWLDPSDSRIYGFAYEYNDAGNRQKKTFNGEVTYYDYNNLNQLMAERVLGGEATYYTWAADGEMATKQEAAGRTYYTWDVDESLSKIEAPATTLESKYNARMQRVWRREDGEAEWLVYDAQKLVAEATTGGLERYYLSDLANQLLSETTGNQTTRYRYDACGNLITQRNAEGLTRYRWDYNNRLTQLDQPGDVHSYFGYDADGKRVTKEDAAGFTRFIYQGPDMLALLQERDAAGNVVAHYTMGDGLEAMRRGEESRFYHYDWLGSTFELTDAAGAVTDEYLYDAWGNALAASGTTPNPHRYVGRERYYEMPGTGLYHVGLRQLDVAVGRFLSVDPVGDGRNWYHYVLNTPSGLVDPSGLTNSAPGNPFYLRGAHQTRPLDANPKSDSYGQPHYRSPIATIYKLTGKMERMPKLDYDDWLKVHFPTLSAWSATLAHRVGQFETPVTGILREFYGKWTKNDASEFNFDKYMSQYLSIDTEEQRRYGIELGKAVNAAEQVVERSGKQYELWGWVYRMHEVDQTKHPVWRNAIGGHMSWAKAFVSRNGNRYTMTFIWVLEDTFLFGDKQGGTMGRVEAAGRRAPFHVTGRYTQKYSWDRGKPVYPRLLSAPSIRVTPVPHAGPPSASVPRVW